MQRFHELRVGEVRREAGDSVAIALVVPPELEDEFSFVPGQYLTFRTRIDGQEVRRCYSICSGLGERDLRVAVKAVEGGAFSHYATRRLAPGDRVLVAPPEGRFVWRIDRDRARSMVAFAAGSGITPVLSIITSVLEGEPASRCDLFYGNRDTGSVMFRDALDRLKDRFPARISVTHILSREPREIGFLGGRIDAEKCALILNVLVDTPRVDGFYLCGPEDMNTSVAAALLRRGVDAARIHREHFTPSGEAAPVRRRPAAASNGQGRTSTVTAHLDGTGTTVDVPFDGPAILDALLGARADIPHACKGGMCCTCRARVVEGEVEMDRNYTLAADEIGRGFVLTCQAHPLTERVVLDYDAR